MPNNKRLLGLLAAIVVLLAIAGVLGLLLLVFPAQQAKEPSKESFSQVIVEVSASSVAGASSEPVRVARDYTVEIQHLNQYENLMSGCEVVSLAVAMQVEGFAVDPVEIANEYLREGDDIERDYLGSPWENGGGYPPSIVDAANAWLADNGGGARAVDLTGMSFDSVCALVDGGYPVLVWTTEGLTEPYFDDNGWYQPEHCVVLYGYDNDLVYVSDSLEGLVARDRDRFAEVYEACGNRAAYVMVM